LPPLRYLSESLQHAGGERSELWVAIFNHNARATLQVQHGSANLVDAPFLTVTILEVEVHAIDGPPHVGQQGLQFRNQVRAKVGGHPKLVRIDENFHGNLSQSETVNRSRHLPQGSAADRSAASVRTANRRSYTY
jgi:hypothetical protein